MQNSLPRSYASLFLSGTFGAFTLVANNLPNPPVYPVAAPASDSAIQPTSKFYFQAGIYDGNAQSQEENNHGVNFRLSTTDGALIFSEIGFLLNQSAGDRGLKGTYKLGSFVHTGNFDTWNSQAQAALGTGSLQRRRRMTTEFTGWSTRNSLNQEAEVSACFSAAAALRRMSIS